LVTQALSQYAAEVPSVGVCNAPFNMKMMTIQRLEKLTGQAIDPSRGELNTLGLNHLTWHRGFTLDGEEMWPRVIEDYHAELRVAAEPDYDPKLIESLRMIPNYYLEYFYATDRKLAEQKQWPPSRAEQVIEIEDNLLRQYADPDRSEPPADLMKRGGAYYSTVATQLLNAHYNDLGETHVCNVRHAGAVPGWPIDWVLELPCRVDRAGIHPLPADPLPPVCFGLLAQVKMYELLTVEAAVHGDRNAAYQALITNPLGPKPDRAQAVLDDLLETNRKYLPQFFK
jgi:6-phospho-beta-glucosidase